MCIWATVVQHFFYAPQATGSTSIVGARRASQSSVSEMRHLQMGVCKDSIPDDGTTSVSTGDTQSTFHHHWHGHAGPFTLKNGHTCKPVLIKSYIFILVCFSNKASHIEIISDLTTEAFLVRLERFIAWRGLPQEIHLDSGSNFLGAKMTSTTSYSRPPPPQLSTSTYFHREYNESVFPREPLTSEGSGRQL